MLGPSTEGRPPGGPAIIVQLACTCAEASDCHVISTIREYHTGGLRFAVNRQLVQNDQMRRSVALDWLRRRQPADAKAEMQRIVPHTELWFSIVDRVEPRLGAIARMNIEAIGSAAGRSSCGNPAEDFLIVNGAEAMPGVPSLRLCPGLRCHP